FCDVGWLCVCFFFFSSRRRHTRFSRDWSSDVCSSDLVTQTLEQAEEILQLCRTNNIKAQVGHVERYNPAFTGARKYIQDPMFIRSEERRVGKECRYRWSTEQ